MVGKSTFHMEWESNSASTPRPQSGDRCIPSWLGCSFRRNSHGGLLSEEERAQHINLLELKGGAMAVKMFASTRGTHMSDCG